MKHEYKVVPDVAQPVGYEVHSIESVTAASANGDREYQPFYSFRHGGERGNAQTFWYASRRRIAARTGSRHRRVFGAGRSRF